MVLRSVRTYVSGVSAAAILVAAVVTYSAGVPPRSGAEAAVFFAAFGALAQALGYQVTRGTSGSIGFLPFLSAAILAPNASAIGAVLLAVAAGEILQKQLDIRGVFNTAQHTLAIGLGILVYRALGGVSLLGHGSVAVHIFGDGASPAILPIVGLSAVYLTINKLAVSVVLSLVNRRQIVGPWLASMKSSIAYDLLAIPLVGFFALAYDRLGPVYSLGLALPMLGLRQLYKTNFELEKINEELLQLMVAAIEARDPYTSGHSQRVARYSRVVGRAAGLGSKAVERVYIAALLHDVGKIHEEFAPILRKPGRLTEAEFEIMKTHSVKSAQLAEKVTRFRDLVPAIRGHHEEWNGSGYPDRLAGEAIPFGARIIAFADTIDAMTTSRPYRGAMSTDEVRDEIFSQRGLQFDPQVTDAVISGAVWDEMTSEIEIATREFPIFPRLAGAASVSVGVPPIETTSFIRSPGSDTLPMVEVSRPFRVRRRPS
jgi:hypothetical protein